MNATQLAFRAGWLDYHLGVSSPRDRTYARGALFGDWAAGWRRAAAEQDSRHWELWADGYHYVGLARHRYVADLPTVSRAWAR